MMKCNLLQSHLFGFFMIKQCVEFTLIFFDTVKQDCVIKTKETFSFLSLTNNSVPFDFFVYVLCYLTYQ